jgi:TRAP-type C4-dicarboxylate transport system substrate-binding protein
MICTKLRVAAIAVAALAFSAGATRAEPQYVAKFGLATLNDAQHVFVKNYAAALERDSGGRIKADVYPASQLGSIPRMIEQTQFGSIQMWAGPPEFLVGIDQRFELMTAPGLFKSMEQANKVLQDPQFAPSFLSIGEPKGLVGVSLFLTGPESFVMRNPVRTVAGFEGLKIRVLASPMQTEQLRALKATAVPMSLGEVLPALQQGALDGVMGSAPVFTPLRYYSAAKYLVETEQCMVVSMAVISRKWLRSLPADLQKIVIDDGKTEAAAIFPTSVRMVNESFGTWQQGGGEVIRLAPEEQAKFNALMAPVAGQVVAQHPEEQAMYQQLLTAVKRAE